jgi:hypothetical protein
MSGDDLRREGPGARAENVAAFLAREVDVAFSMASPPGGAGRLLIAARERNAQKRRQRRALAGAGLALGAAAVMGLVLPNLTSAPLPVLSYTVDGVTPPSDGYVRSTAAQEPTLAFSDGTHIHMMRDARARVVEVGRRGAHVTLEEGRAHVQVVHRPGADWQVEAGSFVIHVHGTSFFVEWNAAAARLNVQMESGVVSVDGPRPGQSVTLRAGQSLSARPGEAPTLTTADQALAVRVPSAGGSANEGEHVPTPAPGPGAAPAPALEPVAPRAPAVASPVAPRPRWSDRLADGEAAAIVAEAQRRGIASVLATSSSEDLAALADAARFRKQDRLAGRVLMAQRTRFPGTVRAQEASFLLGRLADGPAGRDTAALAWYDRYLREAPSGAYADEAMGRMMIVLLRQHRTDEARKLAAGYLRRFPHGSYADAAQAVTSQGP